MNALSYYPFLSLLLKCATREYPNFELLTPPPPFLFPVLAMVGSFRRSLAMADAQLGCWHPNTISAAADLGACLSELGESGDWKEAEHVLTRVR